jgi:hypothetical protein
MTVPHSLPLSLLSLYVASKGFAGGWGELKPVTRKAKSMDISILILVSHVGFSSFLSNRTFSKALRGMSKYVILPLA